MTTQKHRFDILLARYKFIHMEMLKHSDIGIPMDCITSPTLRNMINSKNASIICDLEIIIANMEAENKIYEISECDPTLTGIRNE